MNHAPHTLHIRLITFAIALLATIAGVALPPSAYPSRSPLASGHWVRVTTPAEGIYQLTYDALRGMGFSDPARVRVWQVDPFELSQHTFTADIAAGMVPAPAMHTADGRLLFYGQGEARIGLNTTSTRTNGEFTYARNYYDRSTSYLISDAVEAPEMQSSPWFAPTTTRPLTSHLHADLFEEELTRVIEGGVLAQGRQYSGGDLIPFSFHIKNWQPAPIDSLALFRYVVDVTSESSSRMTIQCPDNVRRVTGSNLSAANAEFPDGFTACQGYMLFAPPFGQTYGSGSDVTLYIKTPSRFYNFLAADRAMLAYPRANLFDDADPSLVMILGGHINSYGQEYRFPGASADTRMWLIDRLRQPVELLPNVSSDPADPYVTFTLPRTATRAIAFEPGRTFPAPQVVGAIPNSNLAAAPVPDLLIVTTDALLPEAQRLADMHRAHQGLDVLVVTQKQVSNEFCAGAPHVMGARLLAKMLYDRDPAKFKYLLMFGPTFNDPRGIETTIDFETLVSYQTDNERYCMSHVKSYASDNYFGMLDDAYDHSRQASQPTQVAVGRVSARMLSQARDYNEKALRWFQNPPTPGEYSSGILISGSLNKNAHVEHTLEVQREMTALKPDFAFTQIPARVLPYDPSGEMTTHHNILLEALRRGAGYMSYSGHGSIYFIDNTTLLSTRTVTTEEYDRPPFVMLSSCAQFCFDRLGSSLLESMVLFPRGGAIAGVAACRDVYLNYNQTTCLSVGQAYAAATPGATVGSVYLDARRRVLQRVSPGNIPGYEPDELLNNMSYNLAGDPAMPLYIPTRQARATSGTTVEPLKSSTLAGSIYNPDGTIDTSFSGKVHITIFDGAHTVSTLPMGETDFKPIDFDMENDIIGTADGTVTAGNFTADIVVHDPLYSAPTYRALISAVRSDSSDDGAIGTAWLTILPLPDNAYDEATAPVITSMYADRPDFASGDRVNPTFTLYAEIDPGESGINYATAGISARTTLVVDGITPYAGLEGHITRRPDGTSLLAVPMVGLAEGYHNIELTVANNAGLITRSSIDVMTLTTDLKAAVTVADATVTDYSEFDLEADEAHTPARLFVTDAAGATVHTVERPALPYRWNLTDADGRALPDGRYNVRILLRDDRDYGEATPASFVILR